jgi:hypothetical protein
MNIFRGETYCISDDNRIVPFTLSQALTNGSAMSLVK